MRSRLAVLTLRQLCVGLVDGCYLNMKQEQRERAAELRASGLSYRAIGKVIGVSDQTVRCWLDPAVAQQNRERNRERSRERYKTLRGRCLSMLWSSRRDARLHGHSPVDISLDDLMKAAAAATVCCVCGKEEKHLQLEHSHSTGEFRGFVCHRCNQAIGSIERTTSSKYTGVVWDKRAAKWKAQTTVNKKNKFIGYSDDEFSAAWMRDAFVKQHLTHAFLNNLQDRRQRDRRAA